MKIGIVGYGVVGHHLEKLATRADFEVSIFDRYHETLNTRKAQDSIQACDLVFVSVPTPSLLSGGIDLGPVVDAVNWILPPIVLKSTVVPGTTEALRTSTQKSIIFSPEYIGESPFHKYAGELQTDLVVLGGPTSESAVAARFYRSVLGPDPRYIFTDSISAEVAKYMENSFFATKLAFVAQFADIALKFGADFEAVRDIWVADSRVGLSHSIVIDKPGFGGRCLPKDLAAIVHAVQKLGGAPLLEAVLAYNELLKQGQLSKP